MDFCRIFFVSKIEKDGRMPDSGRVRVGLARAILFLECGTSESGGVVSVASSVRMLE